MLHMHDIIIIGGGCAGLTAAVYSARAGKKVLVIESETIGGQITAAPCIENYPAISRISGMDFADRLYEQAVSFGAEFEFDTVTGLENTGNIKRVIAEDSVYEASAVIIAAGSKCRPLGIDKEKQLTGHGISYCAMCDGAFFKGKTAVVAGGGNTAFTDALFLAPICKKVYIVHRRGTFRADNTLIEKSKQTDNIEIITDAVISELHGETSLTGITLTYADGTKSILETDALFAAIGRIASNDIFKDVVSLDENGYIIADESCLTSSDGIFAAGDCRKKAVRQLTTAAADGACAAAAALKIC